MKGKLILLFCILIINSKTSFSQAYFKLRGVVENHIESEMVITVYKNWVEDPQDFVLELDKNGKFSFQTPLNDIAYLDINYGSNGLYSWLAEPGDDIFLKIDNLSFWRSLKADGNGSDKWEYKKKQIQTFEKDKDWERELIKMHKISKKGFYDLTTFIKSEEIKLLNSYQTKVSNSFYSLAKADIYGQINHYNLQYLVNKSLFTEDAIKDFELKILNAKVQEKSLKYGMFLEALLENYLQLKKVKVKSNKDEFDFYLDCFYKHELLEKNLIERLIAVKLNSYILINEFSEENKLMVASFKEFSSNKIYSNFIINKLNKLKAIFEGQKAQNFELIDLNGKSISLKDLNGSNILLNFYTSWCGPCEQDISYLPIVLNYFKSKKNLQIINIAVDNKKDFENFIESHKPIGFNARIDDNHIILKNYDVSSFPKYLLINKKGELVSENVIEPALDEGRGLINQLERVLYPKNEN